MYDWQFGLTVTIVGMSITLLTLYLLTLLIRLLNRMFPFKEDKKAEQPKP